MEPEPGQEEVPPADWCYEREGADYLLGNWRDRFPLLNYTLRLDIQGSAVEGWFVVGASPFP